MKIKLVLVLSCAAFLSLLISSYRLGPAHTGGYDCTGATGTRTNCGGGGCHGTTASNAVTIELDSAGTAVTSYYPGQTYTVKISGTNGTGANLTKFGFQMAAVKLVGAGTSTPSQGGTWDSTSLPTNVQYTPAGPSNCSSCSGWPIPIVEHSNVLTPTSGTGANGTVYSESITWTAPDSGTGSIKLYGTLNAVNNNNDNSGDYSQQATPVTIPEAVVTNVVHAGIHDLNGKIAALRVYPTLMNDQVNISFDLKDASQVVNIDLISLQGQVVKNLAQQTLNNGAFHTSYDVNGLAPGIYFVRVQIGNSFAVSKVVKE